MHLQKPSWSFLSGRSSSLEGIPGLPRTRFAIVCAARTGSTMLRTMLNSHPQIVCHGEVFTPGRIAGYANANLTADKMKARELHRLRRSDPVRFLEQFVFRSDANEVVGAKLKYGVFESREFAGVATRVINDPDVLVIHLTRRNHLARIVSGLRVKATKMHRVKLGQDLPVLPLVSLTFDDMVRDITNTRKAERRFRTLFSGHPVLEVAYEDVHQPENECLADLQNFLGVAPAPMRPTTIKLSSGPLREALTNYEDLAATARGTPYEKYFD